MTLIVKGISFGGLYEHRCRPTCGKLDSVRFCQVYRRGNGSSGGNLIMVQQMVQRLR